MVLDYIASVGLVREDPVCPHCGSDLILRIENDFIIIMCVDCEFTIC